MLLSEIIREIEKWAPPKLQESYDNAGLIVGNPSMEITGAVVCLDSIEAVLDEAISLKHNLIIAHHPIVFSGLKRFNNKTYIERVVEKAIKHDIAIYAAHTNLDNVKTGVNKKLADVLGITNPKILLPKQGSYLKLVTFVPQAQLEQVSNTLFKAGAGQVGNYDQCSYRLNGEGTFRANEGANPYIGNIGEQHKESETRLEVIVPNYLQGKVEHALKDSHPYEVVAYDWFKLENKSEEGSGMIGELDEAIPLEAFLKRVKENLKAEGIRYTNSVNKAVKRIAICGGSGSFLLGAAKAQRADVFLTADYKYHQFFDADNDIVICDVGHFESEQYTIDLIVDFIREKFPTFAVRSTDVNTNPINYF